MAVDGESGRGTGEGKMRGRKRRGKGREREGNGWWGDYCKGEICGGIDGFLILKVGDARDASCSYGLFGLVVLV